ncbi:hypothetical protein EET67_18165 [Pseudaminobacter arsenicus]|uniref:Uncharacterized protein n=1 Tax=Borborobacter arsenicus TaxID=1851146 RepID=A0A432V2R7_9HYPH|nr:hypothetical protein [Pseudaminobacter arsenicus]RUM96471.1 hypothetical protein EET67_18165 [Pseudaminobacter arsenicus]
MAGIARNRTLFDFFAGERFTGFAGRRACFRALCLKVVAVFHMRGFSTPAYRGIVVKALLIVIVAQFSGPDVTEIRAPTILYFSSMDVCEEQKSVIVKAFDEMAHGPLSELPKKLKLTIAARCSPAVRW